MNEERQIAEKNMTDSPVWDSIEETHTCYNNCVTHAIANVKKNSVVFIASHNQGSVDLAKSMIQ